MALLMAKDSTGNGMEMHADKNGDIVGEVSVTKNGKCVEEWLHPNDCASGAVNALRRELSFKRDADNAERATWTIAYTHREVNVNIRLLPEEMGTMITLEMGDRLNPGDAEQVLSDWFPEEAIQSGGLTSFLRDEPPS
jgi:hypothetical protein